MTTQKRKTININGMPWAILPDRLSEIKTVYERYLSGSASMEASEKMPEDYDLIDSTAVIQIVDIITKNPTFWDILFGSTSSVDIARQLKSALDDPSVESILLNIDSPGGLVDGTQELADLVYSSRGRKPIVAYSDGMIASAAYWIGSAADRIYISGDTISIGSIGVVATHREYSAWEKKVGIKTTEIYAGKYKRIASQYKPLSQEGKASIQDRVDYLYSIFVDEVAKHRGVSSEKVLKDMADARIFIGKQAVAAGLVDGISTFDNLIITLLPKAVAQSKLEAESFLQKLNTECRKKNQVNLMKKEWNSNPGLQKRFNDFDRYFDSINTSGLKALNDSFIKKETGAMKKRAKGII